MVRRTLWLVCLDLSHSPHVPSENGLQLASKIESERERERRERRGDGRAKQQFVRVRNEDPEVVT
jgi:hypothetical protein